jgi:hypothetical protein
MNLNYWVDELCTVNSELAAVLAVINFTAMCWYRC